VDRLAEAVGKRGLEAIAGTEASLPPICLADISSLRAACSEGRSQQAEEM